MDLSDVKVISLPKVLDERGNLSFIEANNHFPFDINRVYWIYDVPGGEIRGGHAYSTLTECIVCLSGSFDLILHDGNESKTISLNRSYNAVIVPSKIWKHMENFSTNSLALILADQEYKESDYIRNFEEYQNMQNQKL